MEYRTRTPRETARNARRARYAAIYQWSYQVIDELERRGITDYPAHLKGMTEGEYRDGLIDVLIDNELRIA